MYYWSMSPAYFGDGLANGWSEGEYLALNLVDGNDGVRPVINVTTDSGFTSGDGSTSTPYVITTE